MEGFHDESGLFAIGRHRQAAHMAYLGLHTLEHRGGRGAGIVASDGDLLRSYRGRGSVAEVFGGPHLQSLRGQSAIGQVARVDTMPLVARYRGGQVALAMSGRFTNSDVRRDELKARGALFTTSTDAEVLLHLMAESTQSTLVNRLVDALWKVDGGFSLVLLSEDRLVAVRDPRGFRPLVRGRVDGATVVASEDGPIRFLGGEVRGEVEPGQMIVVDARGESAVRPFLPRARAACIQELVQLSPADAHAFGQAVYPLRVAVGERLARERPCEQAQVVVGLPGAGTAMAVGYARVGERPAREGLVDTGYRGRDLVSPPQELPDLGARLRWTPVPAVVDQQAVALVLPSIGRGTGVRKAIALLRGAGAREVHVRVGSPPITGSCLYGVASPTVEELAVPSHAGTVDLSGWLGADSLGFLGLASLHAIMGRRNDGLRLWCDGCFSGEYPVVPPEPADKDQLPLFGEDEE